MSPLPFRPANRVSSETTEQHEENLTPTPLLADTPDVPPLDAEDSHEEVTPLLAEEDTEEELDEDFSRLLDETPVATTSFKLPAPTVYVEPTAPAPTEVATPAASVEKKSFIVEQPSRAERKPTDVPLTEAEETQAFLDSLSREVKESIHLLFEHITDEESSEVILNGPNLVGIKRSGQRFFDNRIDFVDAETYHGVLNHFVLPLTNTHDRIGTTEYLIEGQLKVEDTDNPNRPPLVARIHIIAPPAVEAAKVTIAKKSRNQFTVDTLVQSGSMSPEMGECMKALARGRATIIFSGLSGSGKTTLLEAISRDFDVNDRIVLVEDTAELTLSVSDVVELTSTQAKPGDNDQAVVTLDWLVRQANRMRPDRIIVGEVRGAEMAEFLTAANSGADGSMTTVHASTPQQTINKVVSLAMKAESSKSESSILKDIASSVQIIVQMTLIDGKHIVSQIEEVSNTVLNNGNGIATNPIYIYDRNSGQFQTQGRFSDEFKSFLSQRGVNLPKSSPIIRNF